VNALNLSSCSTVYSAMRSTIVTFAAVALTSTVAEAQRVEYVATVKATQRSGTLRHHIGDPRYVAIGSLHYETDAMNVEVLDIATRSVTYPRVKSRALLDELARRDPSAKLGSLPEGELVMYTPQKFGLFLEDGVYLEPRRAMYAEVDTRSGGVLRTAKLANLDAADRFELLGADTAHGFAWMWHLRESRSGGREVAIRRLDLKTLAFTDVMSIPLAEKTSSSMDQEGHLTVFAANDFMRFAVVEYHEKGIALTPGAQVYILDAATRRSFSVPAPLTAYGIAFTPDGYLYLGSAQTGEVSRVDLGAQRVDKVVSGPYLLGYLAVSPAGQRLFALASSSKFTTYDLPKLSAPASHAHVPKLAPAMAQLSGGGVVAGEYFVLPQALEIPPGAVTITGGATFDEDYLIGRFVD
jgi:hypothetical protein